MLDLFLAMMKEEWRIHSTIFGSLSFALFPVMICGIAFMASFLIPIIQASLPPGYLTLITHGSYLMLGVMVGGFGLLGSEVMNRRFGQVSLLAYSARSLPIRETTIFLTFVVKDTVYYFLLWVLPFGFGYILASPFTGVPLLSALLLLTTLSLSFLFGLSGIFLLSSVYARSTTVFWLLLIILFTGIGGTVLVTAINPALFFPPLLIYNSPSVASFLLAVLILVLLFSIATLLFDPISPGSAKRYPNAFTPLSGRLSFLPDSPLVAKDLLDLFRSGSLIGQTIFSFILPLVVIWFFLSLLEGFLPPQGLIFLVAITTGIIASTMYTWVTMFDTFGPYACLPIDVSTIIAGKLTTCGILQMIPAIFIATVAILSGDVIYLIPSVVLSLSVSFYATAVMVWLSGLSPNVLVYDVKVLAAYLFLVGIAIALLTAAGYSNPDYAYLAVLLAIPSWCFIRRGRAWWNASEPEGF
ncbi:hypothetical protein FTO68_00110 [Methanocalculus taiwanensis]|uniref:ABC transporter permease n=1 Tax=Methanocalculus taiwanensis TaxID=106207 RepID=A0ABD4TGT4_9EURY|nr:hypothetical protein [Methanocalculus taiwanensis]MCQ1537414.1 hypothetical protein [Methanocalculus taiwanensis]